MKPIQPTPFPKHLEIETTNVCQLACPFCPHHKMNRAKGMMSIETLKEVMKQCYGKGVQTCYMHMIGEPLIHPKIVEMVNFVSAFKIWTSISTNAMLLDSEMIYRLMYSDLDELTLALDSLNPETYHKLRVKGDFKRVINNIDACLEARAEQLVGPRIELQVIVMKENAHEIPEYKTKYEPIMERINKNVEDPRRKSWLRIKGFSTFAGEVPDMAPDPTEPIRFKCKKLWESIAIHWNGDLSLCCRDYDARQIVGNVHKDNIEDVWKSALYEELRAKHRDNDYAGHPLLNMCVNC